MPSRDLSQARLAFATGDPQASIAAHSPKVPQCEPGHEVADSAWKVCIVFGAFEGVTVAVAVLSALTAVHGLDDTQVVALALACCVGIALALWLRDYIRFRAYMEHYYHERKREKWELANFRDGEINEMVELYMTKGLSKEDAKTVVHTLAKYETFFVNVMMDHELELPKPDTQPFTTSFGTFISFFVSSVSTVAAYLATAYYRIPLSSAISALPVGPLTLAAVLCALWTTVAWAIVKRHLLQQHRGRGLWMQLFTFITCCTVVFAVRASYYATHLPVSGLLNAAAGEQEL